MKIKSFFLKTYKLKVNASAPGSCPDWRSWSPVNALQNTKKAMKAAETNLSITGVNEFNFCINFFDLILTNYFYNKKKFYLNKVFIFYN